MSRYGRAGRLREDGASAVEYGLLVAAIAAVILIVVFVVGRFTAGTYQSTSDNFEAGDFPTSETCPA